jgi:hypothetical protein
MSDSIFLVWTFQVPPAFYDYLNVPDDKRPT